MTPLLDYADLILELRQLHNMTQEQLAGYLRMSLPTINRWENRRAKPSRLALQSIQSKLEDMGDTGQDLLTKYFSN